MNLSLCAERGHGCSCCLLRQPWLITRPPRSTRSVTDFQIIGEIEHVDIRNPHSVMDLRVANDDGPATVWHIEFSSVNLLLRRGWDFDRLKAGERVTCIGNPSALGKHEMYMWSIVLADGTEFGR